MINPLSLLDLLDKASTAAKVLKDVEKLDSDASGKPDIQELKALGGQFQEHCQALFVVAKDIIKLGHAVAEALQGRGKDKRGK